MSFIPGRLDGKEIQEKIEKSLDKNFHLSEQDVHKVMQTFWHQDAYNSLISFPEYLDYFIIFLNKTHRIDFSRAEFISFLIKEIVTDKKTINKLMEMSVVMELLQVNEVEPEKLQEIFKQLKVDNPDELIKDLITNLVFEERTVDEKKFIGYRHHSLQEYLATQYILKSKNPFKTTQQLVLIKQEGLTSIKPSWYNTIRFLVEGEHSETFIKWLISLGKNKPKIIDEGYSNTLTSANTKNIPIATQIEIFDLIYETYQKRAIWLPLWARNNLVKFCHKQHLAKLREDIKPTNNETVTFVHRGNVADIIGRLLENNSPLMTDSERSFWKPLLTDFANDANKNGVLQRHSLTALISYKDPELIAKVEKAFTHPDKLVRDEFIEFCYETDPNNSLTIKYLVEGTKDELDIYARHGIYKINSKDGIKLLLSYFAQDEAFLTRFLDRESIFNKEEEKGDKAIVDHIRENFDISIIQLLKNVIKTAYQASGIYHQERSYFLEQLAQIILENDSDYLFEVLTDIEKSDKNRWHLLCNYEELFTQIIKPEQLEQFFKRIKELDEGNPRIAEMTIYKTKNRRGKIGEEIYLKAVDLDLIKPLKEQAQETYDPKKELYQEFQRLLEPSKGQYFPTVFEFYNKHRKELQSYVTNEDKQRLAKLALEEGLKKVEPRKIEVKINWGTGQTGRQFSISTIGTYYGDLLRTAQELIPPEVFKQYRQNIIDFIPYAYSDDQQTILEITEPIKDAELSEVNGIYLDKDNDARYLIPDSYIYLVQRHLEKGVKLTSALPVLKSFVTDEKILLYEREYALKVMEGLISSEDNEIKELLVKLFNENKDKPDTEKIGITANKILISVYQDPEAIKWRFGQLKERLSSFKEPEMGIAHSVGPIEEELDSKWFAKPIINLKSDKYIPDFLNLLDFSFKQIPLADEKSYWAYIRYLWSVVIAYFDNLKQNGSFEPIKKLEKWLEKNSQSEGLNWLKEQARNLYTSYELHFGTAKNISEAIAFLEKLKKHE